MDIKKLISEMTLEEKAGLCSGSDFWHTKAIERLNIPPMMVSDGPHGLRKQDDLADHMAVNESIKAVCFPTGVTLAASFDRDLVYKVGEYLGEECQAENVGVILGPAVNIKRSPLCGRNFEYLSEDPYLAGELAKHQILGTQSKNVGTSIKHYLANNQEHRRMTASSEIDERTLREIYMPHFEKAVKEARPWTVMCSYNRINGEFASESYHYLTEVLRDEWGFDGFVVSDWGAVNERVHGLKAGMDLEMPASGMINDARIVQAVKNGELEEAILDRAVERILNIIDRYYSNRNHDAGFDRDAHHAFARQAAGESMVLLKNDDILPLKRDMKLAFIGEFANKPRYQGGGSSHINSHKWSSALSAVDMDVVYKKGYSIEEDRVDEALIMEAVDATRTADAAVIFAGLPDAYESEGYDRTHMRLPKSHDALIEAVVKVQPNTVVVLHNGSPVEMPWEEDVKGILEAYLAGQAVGEAVIDILFGDVNPSGRLAESFPVRLEDNPSYLYYLGEKDIVEYREGIFVGYRYYDKKDMEVLFPFGHGLSYTSFEYSGLKLSNDKISEEDLLIVTVDVKNVGDVYGKEVVQLYVAANETSVIRPIKELKGFTKVGLEPGETKTVTFTLDKRSFAYFNTTIHDWYLESGRYEILICKSSRDIVLSCFVTAVSQTVIPQIYSLNSTVGDILADPYKRPLIEGLLAKMSGLLGGQDEAEDKSDAAVTKEMMEAMFKNMPLRASVSFSDGNVTYEMLEEMLKRINN